MPKAPKVKKSKKVAASTPATDSAPVPAPAETVAPAPTVTAPAPVPAEKPNAPAKPKAKMNKKQTQQKPPKEQEAETVSMDTTNTTTTTELKPQETSEPLKPLDKQMEEQGLSTADLIVHGGGEMATKEDKKRNKKKRRRGGSAASAAAAAAAGGESAEGDGTVKRGVVYLGRIPHGFYEKEMRAYFAQFGEVTRLRLSRNKKTGKSKHYAFIEFSSEDVAKIVAETMDNYLLYGHLLQCKFIPSENLHASVFVGANRTFRRVPWAKVERLRRSKDKTDEQKEKQKSKLLSRENKKRKQLEELGIEYEFPGYSSSSTSATTGTA
ncbi:hypothetical protein HK102_002001 [Quaeritorhiza haematococci]|nr:hypothetical protein HK102_002001 [Quaeritorhiza haematococci]